MKIRLICALALMFMFSFAAFAQDSTGTEITAPEVTPGAQPAADATSGTTSSSSNSAKKSSKSSKKAKTEAKPKPLQPSVMYVTAGCEACEGLLRYLRQAGVVIKLSVVDRTGYNSFPTVVYTDGKSDHGERIYGRQAQLPKQLKVQQSDTGA